MKKLLILICSVALVVGLTATASATIIKAYDFGTTPAIATVTGTAALPDGWSASFATGEAWRPRVADTSGPNFNYLVGSNNQVAYTLGGALSNVTTGISLDVGYTYTVTAYVGRTANDTRAFLDDFFFRAADDLGNDIVRNTYSSFALAEGDWAAISLSFAVDVASAYAGDMLQLGFNTTASGGSGIIGFDYVTVDKSPTVPEPTTLLLLGSGLAGLGIFSRRRKKLHN